jgi:hypothetical protein
MKYFLQKIQGWREKENKARFHFGRAIEDAIQWHHEHDGQGAVQHFVEKWLPHAANKELIFTKVEKDWVTLHKTGVELIKLYIIKQPSLPIPMGGRSLFQKTFEREIFPGDPNYGGILDTGKLDILSYADPSHPYLPQLVWKPEYGPFRPLIVDIKTAGANFPETYGLAAYDTQLRRYSFLSGVRDGALLWLVKKTHTIKKGSKVTFLEDTAKFKAGQEAIVAATEGENVIILPNETLIGEMEKAQGFKEDGKLEQTKVAKERRAKFLELTGAQVHTNFLTKQRLQFNAGYISLDSANDAGAIAGQQIINIVNAWHQQLYPNKFGVRYPHDDRSDPYFRAFVLGDTQFRDLNFTKVDEESFDDLFAEDEGDDEDGD